MVFRFLCQILEKLSKQAFKMQQDNPHTKSSFVDSWKFSVVPYLKSNTTIQPVALPILLIFGGPFLGLWGQLFAKCDLSSAKSWQVIDQGHWEVVYLKVTTSFLQCIKLFLQSSIASYILFKLLESSLKLILLLYDLMLRYF